MRAKTRRSYLSLKVHTLPCNTALYVNEVTVFAYAKLKFFTFIHLFGDTSLKVVREKTISEYQIIREPSVLSTGLLSPKEEGSDL